MKSPLVLTFNFPRILHNAIYYHERDQTMEVLKTIFIMMVAISGIVMVSAREYIIDLLDQDCLLD